MLYKGLDLVAEPHRTKLCKYPWGDFNRVLFSPPLFTCHPPPLPMRRFVVLTVVRVHFKISDEYLVPSDESSPLVSCKFPSPVAITFSSTEAQTNLVEIRCAKSVHLQSRSHRRPSRSTVPALTSLSGFSPPDPLGRENRAHSYCRYSS